MWLVGVVVRRYMYIYIYRYPHNITYPYCTCISSFLQQQHPYFFVHFLNVFCSCILCFKGYLQQKRGLQAIFYVVAV